MTRPKSTRFRVVCPLASRKGVSGPVPRAPERPAVMARSNPAMVKLASIRRKKRREPETADKARPMSGPIWWARRAPANNKARCSKRKPAPISSPASRAKMKKLIFGETICARFSRNVSRSSARSCVSIRRARLRRARELVWSGSNGSLILVLIVLVWPPDVWDIRVIRTRQRCLEQRRRRQLVNRWPVPQWKRLLFRLRLHAAYRHR